MQMANKLPAWARGILASVMVSGVICLGFLLYLEYIGRPKTIARNFYNYAQEAEAAGNQELAERFLKRAYATWPEVYIAQELEEL